MFLARDVHREHGQLMSKEGPGGKETSNPVQTPHPPLGATELIVRVRLLELLELYAIGGGGGKRGNAPSKVGVSPS